MRCDRPGRAVCPPRSGAWSVGSIGGWRGVSSMSRCAVSVSLLLAVRRGRSRANRLLRWAWGVAERTAGHGVLPVAPLGTGCCRTIARRHDHRCMGLSLLLAHAAPPRGGGGAMTPLEIELPPLGTGCCRALAPGGARTGAWGSDAAMRHRVRRGICPHGASSLCRGAATASGGRPAAAVAGWANWCMGFWRHGAKLPGLGALGRRGGGGRANWCMGFWRHGDDAGLGSLGRRGGGRRAPRRTPAPAEQSPELVHGVLAACGKPGSTG